MCVYPIEKWPTLLSRLLSIVWIIVGIITFSLVTAMLTSEITAASSEPPPNMEDARIGLIDNHMYETIVVANRVYIFFIGNWMFHLGLELLTKFGKTSLKIA